jgi:hypothetical protein
VNVKEPGCFQFHPGGHLCPWVKAGNFKKNALAGIGDIISL